MKKKITLLVLAALSFAAGSFARSEANGIQLPKQNVEKIARLVGKDAQKKSASDVLQMQPAKRGPRRASAASAADQPAGQQVLYSRSGSAYYYFWGYIFTADVNAAVGNVVFGENNKVYFKNLITQYSTGAWTEGTISGSTISIEFPQYAFNEGGYDYYLAYGTLNDDFSVTPTRTLTLNYDAATGDITTPANSDFATGKKIIALVDEGSNFVGYADWNINLEKVTDPLVEAPAGLSTELYSVTAEGYDGSLARVGVSGNDVYVQGLAANLPDTWVKGTISGDKVTFKSGQYLGADEEAGYHLYLVSATCKQKYDATYQEYYDEYTLNNNDIVFNYDAATKTLSESSLFLLNAGKSQANYVSVFKNAQISKFIEVAATPAAPVINSISEDGWDYYKLDYGWGYIDFNVNCLDVDGNYILPEKLSYALWTKVNGEEKQLVTSNLDYVNQATATMTEFPYGYTDNWDVYCTGANSSFYYHVIGPEAFGVQTIYRGAGEEHRSDIAWIKVTGLGSEIQPAAATPAYPDASIQASDKTVTFGYYTNSGENIATVTNYAKPETYDVAVKIDDAALVGNYIKSITFPLQETKSVSNLNVFLTSQLRVEDGKNAADIVVKSVTPAEAGFITVTLDKPYLIPEGGVYAGYSLTIDKVDSEANKTPIAICDKPAQGGFYLHTSDGFLKWLDVTDGMGGSSLLTVDVIGSSIKGDAVVVADGELQYVKTGESFTVPVTLVNHGGNGASSVVVAYEVAGHSGSKPFDVTLSNILGASTTVKLEIPAIANAGTYDLQIKVTQVNGKDNEESNGTQMALVAMNTLPKKHTLLEEYTGLWCGWCPRGYVGLEKLAELYPDEYVLVSYHNEDEMEIMKAAYYPSNVEGFPSAWMDRAVELDAYYGTTSKEFGIADDLAERNQDFGLADITPAATLSADGVINISTEVTFPFVLTDGNYAVEYILTADGLTNSAWSQSNYYADASQGYPLYMDQFSKGASAITGLVFNDVAVLTSEYLGGADNAIQTASADVPVKLSYSFRVADAVNTKDEPVIQDVTKLKVVALLLDKSKGTVINANKTKVDTTTGLSIVERAQDGNASAFDLMGRRIGQPAKGLYIINGRKVVIK